MKNLLILPACGTDATIEHLVSYPIRELGAVVEGYGKTWHQNTPEGNILAAVDKHDPQVIAYFGINGSCDCPLTPFLKQLRSKCRLVHVCFDAPCHEWWPLLEEYKTQEVFDLQISITGRDPFCDWATLTPSDPACFQGGCLQKDIDVGFAGSWTGEDTRWKILGPLGDFVTKQRREAPMKPTSYYADFLRRCRASINVAEVGGPIKAKHVKGRVVESGLAGCMLLEQAGSPTSEWFQTGIDYLEYEGPDDIRRIVSDPGFRNQAAELGGRLREKMAAHHPRLFWQRVIG